MRIAVVGAGISGLVAAHLLHPEHEITVFEADDRIGGHSHTVRVDTPHETHHVDTGFIVYNDRNYPSFEKLLAQLRVASQPTTMSFSVKAEPEDFEYAGTPGGLFAQRANLVRPAFHRMIYDLLRFNREARWLVERGDDDVSLGGFLQARRYSREFIDRLIVPQASAVWSADPRQMWAFPARFLAQFFANHGMLGLGGRPRWRTVVGGSHRYVDALIAPFRDRIRTSAPVRAITRHADHVELTTAAGGEPERFDEVVLATHSDEALAMLADASDRERELLGAIPYQRNEAVLHTDRSLLPRRRRAWASWNYHLLPEASGLTRVTYHMNTLQNLSADREFCVTLNRTEVIDPAKVIKTISYSHPVFTPAGVAAQAQHASISGVNRTHFCGAYWGWGFHEDGVVSALRVGERLGARLPA